jgi:hypothetical protein
VIYRLAILFVLLSPTCLPLLLRLTSTNSRIFLCKNVWHTPLLCYVFAVFAADRQTVCMHHCDSVGYAALVQTSLRSHRNKPEKKLLLNVVSPLFYLVTATSLRGSFYTLCRIASFSCVANARRASLISSSCLCQYARSVLNSLGLSFR